MVARGPHKPKGRFDSETTQHMETTQHWSTPIYRSNLNDPAFVQSLLDLSDEILAEYPLLDDYGTSAVFDNLLAKGDERAIRLFDEVRATVNQSIRSLPSIHTLPAIYKMQLCVLQPGEVTAYHCHPWSYLTGIVYLTPQDTGLILHDPRANAVRGYPTQFSEQFADVKIVPTPGDIVMFPSYVFHSTMVHSGTQPRIVMPFNVLAHEPHD